MVECRYVNRLSDENVWDWLEGCMDVDQTLDVLVHMHRCKGCNDALEQRADRLLNEDPERADLLEEIHRADLDYIIENGSHPLKAVILVRAGDETLYSGEGDFLEWAFKLRPDGENRPVKVYEFILRPDTLSIGVYNDNGSNVKVTRVNLPPDGTKKLGDYLFS